MNSQPRSRAAPATRGLVSQTAALIESVGRMFSRSNSLTNRQNPTRIPYSCQVQLGMSGVTWTPCGAGSTWRAIGFSDGHSSTLTIGQTTTRAPPGRASFGRSTIAE
jgi:hypothetical protein